MSGLSGSPEAARRQDRVGAILGIGYGNAKQLVSRLNNYGITREEFRQAVAQVAEEEK